MPTLDALHWIGVFALGVGIGMLILARMDQ